MSFKFDLQLFGGGGKGETSQTSSYEMSDQQKTLVNDALPVAQQGIALAGTALSDVQNQYDSNNQAFNVNGVNYTDLNNTAQSQIANAQNVQNQSMNGQLSDSYLTNMTDAIKSTLQNTIGQTLSNYANNGVIGSSQYDTANNNIIKNAANSVAQNYASNLSLQNSIANDAIQNASAPMTTSALSQSSALTPFSNMLSLVNSGYGMGTTLLGNLSGTGTTTTTKEDGAWWSPLVSGAVSGAFGAFGK